MRRSATTPCLLLLAAAVLSRCAGHPSPTTSARPAAARPPIGVASFNMAWAGTERDFDRYLEVCGAPAVSWCDTRARVARGATEATAEEQARATKCQESIYAAAGGRAASMLMAPCGAYRPRAPGADPGASRTREAYAAKLAGLRVTVERLIEHEGVSVLAFQEVHGREVVSGALGKFADRFEVCAAPHANFQTVAFAWDRAVTERPGRCTPNDALAIAEDAEGIRRVRPGLALELTIGGAPVTFLNVHLKAGCANIVATERYPARLLDDPSSNCEFFNRQVPLLEAWLDAAAARSPRLVLLGDFNRRIDEEEAAAIPKDKVRSDGSDPAGPNRVSDKGKVATLYLWPEISDGSPTLHQVPLSTAEAACGFSGLDHLVISEALKALNPGVIASRKVPVEEMPGQAIETSDHCPRIVWMKF